MNPHPNVTVIIPTYNRAGMLAEAIESVRAQTYQDWELIVVDDESSDETRDVVGRYCRSDKRVQYRFQANAGVSAARNHGITVARGQYLAFLDDDDLFLPNKLKWQVAFLEQKADLAFVYAPVWISENGHVVNQAPLKLGNTFADLFEHCLPQVSSVLVRRRCLEVVGSFNAETPYCEDYDLWLRLARRFPYDYIVEPVGTWRGHGNNKSKKNQSERYRVILRMLYSSCPGQECGVSVEAFRRRVARLHYRLAREEWAQQAFGASTKNFWKAVCQYPAVGLLVSDRPLTASRAAWQLMKPYGALTLSAILGMPHHPPEIGRDNDKG